MRDSVTGLPQDSVNSVTFPGFLGAVFTFVIDACNWR